MHFPNPKLLVYIGMADAYGAAAEYLKFPRDNDLNAMCLRFESYLVHPTHGGMAGLYTDDTEMSAANVHVLLECDPPYTPIMFANAYKGEFERGGQRKGYSRGFQALLEAVHSGEELLNRLRAGSQKNGAAMRSVPIGAITDIREMLKVATLQARITHDTPVGRFSARAVALMSHMALYSAHWMHRNFMAQYCAEYLPPEDREFFHVFHDPWPDQPVQTGSLGPVGLTTVHAVVHLITQERSLKDILMRAIHWGGDVDSVAAIAWGIASCRYQKEVLPDFLERDLDCGNPHTGTPYLLDLGTRLMAKYNVHREP